MRFVERFVAGMILLFEIGIELTAFFAGLLLIAQFFLHLGRTLITLFVRGSLFATQSCGDGRAVEVHSRTSRTEQPRDWGGEGHEHSSIHCLPQSDLVATCQTLLKSLHIQPLDAAMLVVDSKGSTMDGHSSSRRGTSVI